MYRVHCKKCRNRFLWEGRKETLKACILCSSTMIRIEEIIEVEESEEIPLEDEITEIEKEQRNQEEEKV